MKKAKLVPVDVEKLKIGDDIEFILKRRSMDFEFGESTLGHDLRIGTSFLPYCNGKLFSDSFIEIMMKDFNGDEDRIFLELAKNFLIEIITKYDENRDNRAGN